MFMKFAKKTRLMAAATALAISALVVAGCGGGAKQQYLNIGTGGTAGTYYPLGGAIAEVLNKNIPNMNATAQSTGASVANINMLKDGSLDLAFVQNDIVYYATNGMEMFEGKKIDNLRGIATLYPETIQLVALEKSGMHSVNDLRGKRVAVGAPGSGTEANARQILAAYGLTYNDVQVQYLSFGEASGALKDGNVDAAFVTAGFPTAAIQDIAVQNKVTLLGMGEAEQDALIAKYPFYTKTVIPAGTYEGQTEDVPTISVMAMIVATDKLSDVLGYQITKTIFSNTDRLKSAHAVGSMITKDTAMEGMPIKMNGGSEKFLKE